MSDKSDKTIEIIGGVVTVIGLAVIAWPMVKRSKFVRERVREVDIEDESDEKAVSKSSKTISSDATIIEDVEVKGDITPGIEFTFEEIVYKSPKEKITVKEFLEIIGVKGHVGLTTNGLIMDDDAVLDINVLRAKDGPKYYLETRPAERKYIINVDDRDIESSIRCLNGIEIKRLAGVREREELWMTSPEQDTLIHNTDSVDLRTYKNAKFYTGAMKSENIKHITVKTRAKSSGRKMQKPRIIVVNDHEIKHNASTITPAQVRGHVAGVDETDTRFEVWREFRYKDSVKLEEGIKTVLYGNIVFRFRVAQSV